MNSDFHYYGTFVAACLAGYKQNEAKIIAYSAQFVDDCNSAILRNLKNTNTKPIPTVHSLGELFDYGRRIGMGENCDSELRNVWMAFHFLPGNFGFIKNVYQGVETSNKKYGIRNWQYDKSQEELFQAMCEPNSETVKAMIHATRSDDLHMIGVRMHVLADTWAHQYYVGTPSWFINGRHNEVTPIDEQGRLGASFKYSLTQRTDNLSDGIFSGTSESDNSTAISYLGHGQIGSVPDYACLHYNLRPQWNGDYVVEKNNTEDHFQAFKQMVYALTCFKNNNPSSFELFKYADLGTKAETIKGILKTWNTDQTKSWKKYLESLTGIKEIEIYYPDKWTKANDSKLLGCDVAPDPNYYKFQSACIEHLKFVQDFVKSKGLSSIFN